MNVPLFGGSKVSLRSGGRPSVRLLWPAPPWSRSVELGTFFGRAPLGGFDPSVDELPRERRACDRSHDCEHHVRPKLPIEARTIRWVPHDHLRNEEADQEAEDRPDYSAENYHVRRRVSP
jgi:hypothetical protein